MIVFRAVLVSNIFTAFCNIYGAGALIFDWQIISQLAGLSDAGAVELEEINRREVCSFTITEKAPAKQA